MTVGRRHVSKRVVGEFSPGGPRVFVHANFLECKIQSAGSSPFAQNPSSFHDNTFIGSFLVNDIAFGGMKAVFIALLGLTFLVSFAACWDEDPRCQRRRELNRALAANKNLLDDSNIGLTGSGGRELSETGLNQAPSAGKESDGDGIGILQDGPVLQSNTNYSSYIHDPNEPRMDRDLLRETESFLLQPHNTSGSLLRGKLSENAHRQLQNIDFQVKMYWAEGFCWQDEWIERRWCWQCEGMSGSGIVVGGLYGILIFCSST